MSDNPENTYTSDESVHLALELAKNRKEQKASLSGIGAQFPIPTLKDIIRPIERGETAYVMGHSGNGKSFIAKKLLFDNTEQIMREQEHGQINVIITWEESVEMCATTWMSGMSGISATKILRGDLSDAEYHHLENHTAIDLGVYPIYIIGASSKRRPDGKRVMTDMSRKAVQNSLNWLTNTLGLNIRMLVMDYLQRIPEGDDSRGREDHIRKCVDWIKNLAIWLDCSLVCVTQAKQEVLKRACPVPTLYDSEWSANAAQSGDFCFVTFMPKKIAVVGSVFDRWPKMGDIMVEELVMYLIIEKMKQDRDGMIIPIEIEPSTSKMRIHRSYIGTRTAIDYGHTEVSQEYV